MLGYIDPNYFLGGRKALDREPARATLAREVATPLGLDLHHAALAVLQIATENMVGAIEDLTINQGVDPRGAALVGGGGAAGLNAVAIARQLGCSNVIIPDVGAALSAAGGLISELSTDFAALLVTNRTGFDFDGVNRVLTELKGNCQAFIDGPGAHSLEQRIEFFVEARYANQIWEVEVLLRTEQLTSGTELEQLTNDFHAAHREIFAIEDRDSEVEFIAWRARVHCTLREGGLNALSVAASDRPKAESRSAFFQDVGEVDARVIHVEDMPVEDVLAGPAIVESPFTTVVINPGASVRRNASGALAIVP